MNAFAKKMKKTAFKKAKKVLPQETVLRIQKQRLEGGLGVTYKPNSYEGRYTYSVVSAVYNAEKYLDDFFESLTTQTINGKRLKLVMVDDGSTDGSAKVIANWKQRFPELIDYYYKENGGQASARNLGLDHVTSDWVTFIDPDDFVSSSYFEDVDKSISAYPDLCFITCRIVFLNENKGEFVDNHPLRSEFKKDIALFNVNDDYMPVSLSASKSFFKTSGIDEHGIRFDTRIKPNFEDAHFLNVFLLSQEVGRVAYMRKPIYYYRKRKDGSSTLDSAWDNPDKYSTVLLRGKLDLLERAFEKRGYVPFYIQKTVLYDLQWYFKSLVNHEEKTHQFSAIGLDEVFWDLLDRIFKYIDTSTIEKMPGGWLNFEMKHACAECFKHEALSNSTVYVERIDRSEKLMLIRSFDSDYSLSINGETVEPLEVKEVTRTLFGRQFYTLYFAWFPLRKRSDVLSYGTKKDNKEIVLSVRGKRFPHAISVSRLLSVYEEKWSKYSLSKPDAWLFMDRDTQADDNAEHLYRWVKNHHPEKKCYFAIRQDAKDWERLRRDGFNLVAFGSKEHEQVLKGCSTIISSHADRYVHSYFGDNFYQSKRYVFLQHGVTKDDISGWINGKPIDLMVTAAQAEYDSIVSQGSQYMLTRRQVMLSGFPRHDALLSKTANRKTILIMPTWRTYLCGEVVGKGNTRVISHAFEGSTYARAWEKLLSSDTLKRVSEENQMPIAFFPHSNMFPYIEAGELKVPDYVEVLGNQKGDSIQQVFADAAVMVTDYSSTAFENAYLGKPCIYYQFDKDEFFSGGHVYSTGYFSYEKDGFGPVVETEADFEKEILKCSQQGFRPSAEYAERIDGFFKYRDGHCCERVFNRIQELSQGDY